MAKIYRKTTKVDTKQYNIKKKQSSDHKRTTTMNQLAIEKDHINSFPFENIMTKKHIHILYIILNL